MVLERGAGRFFLYHLQRPSVGVRATFRMTDEIESDKVLNDSTLLKHLMYIELHFNSLGIIGLNAQSALYKLHVNFSPHVKKS